MCQIGFFYTNSCRGEGKEIKKIIFWVLMGLSGFGYEVGKEESLILNIDAKYYKRNESKPFSGIGLFMLI